MTETNFDGGVSDGEFIDDRYNVYRRDRESTCSKKHSGGGILIAVRNHIGTIRQTSWECGAEDLWLSIVPSKPGNRFPVLHLCLCYLPPDITMKDITNFHHNTQRVILSSALGDSFLLLGDFNTGAITWENGGENCGLIPTNPLDHKASLLVETTNVCNLTQFNAIPNKNNRFLDLVFSTLPGSSIAVRETEPVCQVDCHHLAYCINIIYLGLDKPLKPSNKKRFNFKKCDYAKLNSELSCIHWEELLSSPDVNQCVDNFYEVVNDAISRNTPFVRKSCYNYPIWYSDSLIRCLKEKIKFHKRFKKYANPRDYDTFSLLRARCKTLTKKCYGVFLESVEKSLPEEPQAFWRYVNDKKKGRMSIPHTMFYKDKSSSDGQGVCELFSEYFSSVFETPSTSQYSIPLNLPDACNDSLCGLSISRKDIINKIKQLDIRKGPGPDTLPPRFIKECNEQLSLPLAIIFNKSLASGVFPIQWKLAHIIPIFKSGKNTSCNNYRPISILSCVAKLFESLVHCVLYNHLSRFISNKQHGFVRKKSTLSNLLEFKNYLSHIFASGGQVDAIYLDFSKAFDKVDHTLLCLKLAHYGIHGCLLRWIESYLNNRSQLVTVKGFSSSPSAVSSGVPQGSHLGPLLFVVFINDLIDRLSCPALLYADDLKIYVDVESHERHEALQDDLSKVLDWCLHNKMRLNVDKCCLISFTSKKNRLLYQYYLDGKQLSRVDTVRDLGVLFDTKLTFRPHFENILKKSNRLSGFILRSTRDFKSPQSTLFLFFSLVRSVLEYCCPVWSPFYQVHIDNIERVQKKFVKFVCRKHNMSRLLVDYSERLAKFKMIPLYTRRKRYDLLCLHKILHSSIESPDLLHSININTLYRIRSPNTFSLKVYKNNTSFYSPITRMCRSYNELNRSGKDIDVFNNRFSIFKREISKILEAESPSASYSVTRR